MIKDIIEYRPGEDGEAEAKKILTTPCEPISVDGTEDYTELFRDLLDTAVEHQKRCIGLAANQIGTHKRAVVIRWGDRFIPLINPEFVKVSEKTVAMKERCMSLPTSPPRPTIRHKAVTVKFFDPLIGEERTLKLKGRDAVVIQHEMNHLDGVLI